MTKRQSPKKTSPPAPRSNKQLRTGSVFVALAIVLVVGAVWVVYGRAMNSPFIFDDPVSTIENQSIVALWPLVGSAEHPGPLNPPKDLTTSGRPLVNLSLALNYRFGRLDPVGYHFFNLLVHVLAALLVMAIVQRTLRLPYFGGKFDGVAPWLALTVALMWAVHPLQTEAVIYVTQRTELMVGFFYLATLYSSLRYWEANSPAGRFTWLVLSTLACLAGMACKEVMVTAPLVVLLFERTFIAGSFLQTLRKSWPLYLGLASGWALLIYLNYSSPRSLSAGFHLGIPPVVWWLTQMKVLSMYLKLTVWPWPLAIHYEMPYLTTITAAWPWVLATAALGCATLFLLARRNAIGFVFAWVLLILSPTFVVPIITEVAAERRMYLPLAALLALAVVGGYSAAASLVRRRINAFALATGIVLIVVLSLVSVRRLDAYQSALDLWQDAVMQQPGDYLAHNNLGNALHDAGRVPEAIAEYKQSILLNSNYHLAHNNLGAILNESGKPLEAIPCFEEALRLSPDYPAAHNNLGLALATTHRLPEAIEQYKKALELSPDYADAHFNLSLAWMNTGNPKEAALQCEATIKEKPEYSSAWANLAMAQAQLNEPKRAIASAEKALELARRHGETALAQEIADWLATLQAAPANRSAAP